jgi:murein L,D-transpeptidase YcbB/YkuD
MRKVLLACLVLSAVMMGCKNKLRKIITTDTSINEQTSYNNLFLDSIKLDKFIASDSGLVKFKQDFFDFYKHRNYEFAWFDTSGLIEQSHNFYNLQNSYITDIKDSSIFSQDLQKLYEQFNNHSFHPNATDASVIKAELLLTGQFFKYTSKVYQGSDINATELGWFIPRKKIDVKAALDSMMKTKGKGLDDYEPLNADYRQLEKYLLQFYALKNNAIWDSIITAKSLKKGDSNTVVQQVKMRLIAFGDLQRSDTSQKFDTTLQIAVKQFQKRYGLNATGQVGAATFKELNRPIDTLIRKILVNMERARWMLPDTLTTDHLIVNIPEYKLQVYDSGKYSFNMNVVVGTAANSTVIFNGRLLYIVFSPYWNVTEDITKKEVIPAMKRDPNYLAKNNMEITGYNGKIPVVRQKPGPSNSLGGVKFLFPNSYNIYLHDTPNKELFSASKRSFSHGCIRLGEPAKLAQFLLRRDTLYTMDSIKTLMKLPKEKWLTIKPTVPVTIKYFTAWVDREGLLNFRDDIYHHDAKMADKLFAKK